MSDTLSGLINSAMPSPDDEKYAVWLRGAEIPGFDPWEWRTDALGNRIRFSEYGKLTEHGWEIDHRTPSALGGLDTLTNKRPLHWHVNRSLGGSLASMFSNRAK